MKQKEKVNITGRLVISDLEGNVFVDDDNLVMTVGKEWIASRLANSGIPAMTNIAVGTGTSVSLATMTALENELFRKAMTVPGGSVSDNIVTYTMTLLHDEGIGPLTEAAIFDNDTAGAGIMLCRRTFNVVNKSATMGLLFGWTIKIS